ncbi:MAG: hypothetical protein R2717_01015 [Schumannella sp.]
MGSGSGVTIVGQRDDGQVLILTDDSETGGLSSVQIGTVPGVVHSGEGGLLGLAYYSEPSGDDWLYAYETTAIDNRIVRIRFGDEAAITSSLRSC